jgi:MoxR-like ATPase
MRNKMLLIHFGLFASLGLNPTLVLAQQKCSSIYKTASSQRAPRDTQTAWKDSVEALNQINQMVYGRKNVIEALTSAILAKEFVWINGEPGGAKTLLSRIMFQSVLNSIPETDKRIFVLQFHKLISEGKIIGFQKFSSMMKEGKYEIETSTSLVGDQFLFLIADEAEKSNPAVLNALLGVLNERKAFLGSKVVDSILASGVFTSNKTTGEFIQGFFSDRPSGEALLDRMAIKIHIPNQQLSPKETVAMYNMVKNSKPVRLELPLMELNHLISKVEIPEEVMSKIVEISRDFDGYVTQKSDETRKAVRYGKADAEYFPANQFSNRSMRRLVQVLSAAFISRQLMEGVPFNQISLQIKSKDLALLATSALYVGPTKIQLKHYPLSKVENESVTLNPVSAESKMGIVINLAAEYSPYDNRLVLKDINNKTIFILSISGEKADSLKMVFADPEFKDYELDSESISKIFPLIKKVITDEKINLSMPQFEIDSAFVDALLQKGTIKSRTAKELESIKDDMQQFVDKLNQKLQIPAQNKVNPIKQIPARTTREIRQFNREIRQLPESERTERLYDWMSYEIRALKQRFFELDYSIEAHLTGLLSDNHLYVFGPPGGAKTALAEVLLKSELRYINAKEKALFIQKVLQNKKADDNFLKLVLEKLRTDSPKEFDRFLLQFHKLLPEGVLVGFPKIEAQLNDGIEQIETSTSLASEKFIFAILDEVDKANPQTVTALLSILNEREVFSGSRVIKTALRTAILTSNKMPSEFLESYNEDRSTGEAVMDRTPNKVYVSNKLSSEQSLTQFLMQLHKGISPNWKGLMAVSELKPILNKVEFPNEGMKILLANIHAQFLKARIAKEEESMKKFKMDPREYPNYYVSASGSASDRTFIKLLDQLKARTLVHQLMNGVAYKDLKTQVSMKEVSLFFEGLAYWGPQKIEPYYNAEGVIQFKVNSSLIDQLLQSGAVDSRTRYHLEAMIEEAKDFVSITNSSVHDFISQFQVEIAKFPDLFPGLFNDNSEFLARLQRTHN